jgi:hypothetical protein
LPKEPDIVLTLLPSIALALCAETALSHERIVNERDIPGASKLNADQLRAAARQSNKVLKDLGADIRWVQIADGLSLVPRDFIWSRQSCSDQIES